MKIAIISPGTFPIPSIKGGAVESIIDEIRVSDCDDNKIVTYSIYDSECLDSDVIYIKPPRILKIFDKFIFFILSKILRIKKAYSFRFVLERIHYVNKVSRDLYKNDYDAIIVENSTPLFSIFKKRKTYKKYSGKYYYHLHNELGPQVRCQKIIEQCKKVICVSDFVKNKFQSSFPSFPSSSIVVVKNCVPGNMFSGESFNPFKEMANKKIILFVGRLVYEKGILHVIKALERLKTDNYVLVIVGSSFFDSNVRTPFERALARHAEKIKSNIVFTGFIPHSKLGFYYSNAAFSVLPSVWEEPAGLTMIESISCGTPIITTNRGGISEYLVEGTNICIQFDNDEQLCHELSINIELLLTNNVLLDEMKEKCKQFKKESHYRDIFLKNIRADKNA